MILRILFSNGLTENEDLEKMKRKIKHIYIRPEIVCSNFLITSQGQKGLGNLKHTEIIEVNGDRGNQCIT